MNWLKKLKKQFKEKKQNAKDKRTLNKYKMVSLAHQCMNCKWFTYREDKPRNWVCRCPDEKLRFVGTTCLGFEPGEHPEMIVFSSR
jgi:hypothetical protein